MSNTLSLALQLVDDTNFLQQVVGVRGATNLRSIVEQNFDVPKKEE